MSFPAALSSVVALAALFVFVHALPAQRGGGGGSAPPPDPAIVFRETTSRNVFVRVMNADGSNVRTVVTGGRNDAIYNPSWSPDGTRLAFQASLSGNSGVWVVNLDGSGLQRIVAATVYAIDGPWLEWSPAATPDGRDKIAFQSPGVAGANDLFVVNPDGTGLQNLTNSTAEESQFGWTRMADGFYLGTAEPTNSFALVHLAAAFGGGVGIDGVIPLSDRRGGKNFPRSANTRDLVIYDFLWFGTPSVSGLQTLDPTTTPPVTVQVTNGGELMGSFSPDDTRLAYRRGSNIYTSRADGTGEDLIRAVGNTSCNFPCWKRR